jgi:hypothetical protein
MQVMIAKEAVGFDEGMIPHLLPLADHSPPLHKPEHRVAPPESRLRCILGDVLEWLQCSGASLHTCPACLHTILPLLLLP